MYMHIRLYNLCTSNCYLSCSFVSPASVILTIILIYNIYLYVIIHYVSCTIHVYEIKYLNLNLNLSVHALSSGGLATGPHGARALGPRAPGGPQILNNFLIGQSTGCTCPLY